MKTNRLLLGLALLVAGALPTLAQVSNDNEDGVYKVDERAGRNDFVPGQVLVKFKDETSVNVNKARGVFRSAGNNTVDAVLKEFNVKKMDKLLPNAKSQEHSNKSRSASRDVVEEEDLSQLYLVETDETHAPQTMQLVEKLNELDEVEYAEPNYKVYLADANIAANFGGNPYTTQQWYLDSYGVKQLWNKPILNPKRPVIAILDTGVDMTHPDLAPNLWTNTAEAEGEANYDNDGNGFKGDVHGWDFINNTPNISDFNMHGTHVAGIAAAANNGIGIIGANPMALIMPISVMQSDGSGDVATIVKGIDYAVQMGADVLNLSLGTYANSRALRQALEKAYQTAVIVAAAGNDFMRIDAIPNCHPGKCGYGVMFPAGYSFVLGVQATTQGGGLAGFSNHDTTGPNFSSTSTPQDPDGFNYELSAPGTDMLSTIPGGKYKVLNGTSMAAPLVAGSISALMMVKNYDSQEILWGDLLHTDNIAQAYAVTNRPAELDLMKIMYRERKELADETEEDYSGDGRIDAGETVNLYPVIRTTFGAASNIKMHLEMGDFEDPSTVEILTGVSNKVNFGLHLDAYGKGVSLNPLKLRVADNVANGRHIKMKFVATCDESNDTYIGTFTIIVDNMRKIYGMINEDMTLTADHEWLVSSNLAIPESVTLTIEPGTTVLLNEGVGISCSGNFIAKGTKEEPITFTKNVGSTMWGRIICKNTLSYCIIEYSDMWYGSEAIFDNCYFQDCRIWYNRVKMRNCVLQDCNSPNNFAFNDYKLDWNNTNLVNCNSSANNVGSITKKENLGYENNMVNSTTWEGYLLKLGGTTPKTYNFENLPYMGSAREDIVRQTIYELGNGDSFAWLDLSNMPLLPYSENHGIVWKVCVNGKDAQDEYEDLAPLGVGKHKFEVYFNRPMNKAVTPQISFGVRDPYTQNVVNEDGSWNEEGTIYTAYKTINGKTKSDGVNRIYVWGAEDNEYFEIPYEKTRFNVMVNATGSMATGFAGEAKMGRVELTWNNENNDFEDAMGFNIYRYQLDSNNNKVKNICINKEILDIETTEYTDYDVTPGQTYYYMYKVLSTDLKEYDVSNVVAVTPLTSEMGDANGSGDVDVADVITTVNYAAGMKPKPFIFEAADMNTDLQIDILDVVGIIQKILNPSAQSMSLMSEATATYTVEDGVLYVESPVTLAGVQVQLNMNEKHNVTTTENLNGFEQVSAWLSDNDMLFLAYNMNGKTLTAGKHALLNIGNADLSTLRLSDSQGRNVKVGAGSVTGIKTLGSKVLQQGGIFNLNGQKMSGNAVDIQKLPKGVYIINGEKVLK